MLLAEQNPPQPPLYPPPPEIDDGKRKRQPNKRKMDLSDIGGGTRPKKTKLPILSTPGMPKISVTLKLGPKPPELEAFPCCLCVSMSKEGLLRVMDPPRGIAGQSDGKNTVYMAHKICADVVPETWVDELQHPDETPAETVIFGVDGIVRDRWNLVRFVFAFKSGKSH